MTMNDKGFLADLPPVVTQLRLEGVPLLRSGKVREVFDLEDHVLIVASDRISAFDVVLPNGIPGKGHVLTALSQFWFDKLAQVVPHHSAGTDAARFPALVQPWREQLQGRSMLCLKTEPMPVECVVRGYLAGSGWRDYRKTGAISGIELPPGLELTSRFERPIFTPTTKATEGHDEPITIEEMGKLLGDRDLAHEIARISVELYERASAWALERGIIIADTKFEFGRDAEGRLLLIDEAFTPDSSRFWPADAWQPGTTPPSFDKQPIRDYLDGLDWDKKPPPPKLPDEVVRASAERYQRILRILTEPGE